MNKDLQEKTDVILQNLQVWDYLYAKNCAENWGFPFSLDSVLGQGTAVTITFPVGNMHLLED